jgi:hypothetical protein
MDAGAIVSVEFVQRPQKLNNGSMKMIYPGTTDQAFTAQTIVDC